MKRTGSIALGLLVVILLIVAVKGFSATEVKQNTEVGRFQLFQGTYITLDSKSNRADKESGVFLLDTSTGNVRRYLTGLHKDGKFFEEWAPTDK